MNNPALLFDFGGGTTCGISPVPFGICGTVTTDGVGADSSIVAAGTLGACGFGFLVDQVKLSIDSSTPVP